MKSWSWDAFKRFSSPVSCHYKTAPKGIYIRIRENLLTQWNWNLFYTVFLTIQFVWYAWVGTLLRNNGTECVCILQCTVRRQIVHVRFSFLMNVVLKGGGYLKQDFSRGIRKNFLRIQILLCTGLDYLCQAN